MSQFEHDINIHFWWQIIGGILLVGDYWWEIIGGTLLEHDIKFHPILSMPKTGLEQGMFGHCCFIDHAMN